jgi:hypothetical protein
MNNLKLLLLLGAFFGFNNIVLSQKDILLDKKVTWIKSKKLKDSIVIEDKFSLNFNLPINKNDFLVGGKIKNVVTNKGSLFVVLKSNSKNNIELLTLRNKDFKVNISNKKIDAEKEILISEESASNGVIINYLFNKNSTNKRKGHLILNDLSFDALNNDIKTFEIVYIPENISSKDKSIIETYLSIKYGVSLEQSKNYVTSKGDTIWSAKKNEIFNNRITAIGNDSILGLNQIKSKNALNDGLCIEVLLNDKTNKLNHFWDQSFIIWGDNNKAFNFKKDIDKSENNLERVWKLKTYSNENSQLLTKIVFDKKRINLQYDKQNFIWLAIDSVGTKQINYNTSKFYKAIVDDENQIIFDAINISPNTNYLFSLVQRNDSQTSKIGKEIKTENEVVQGFSIYPNPIYKSQPFCIDFNLSEPSEVNIAVYDINGRLFKNKNLGKIKSFTYQETIQSSGTFLIQVSINDKIQSTKLIVL